MRKAKKLEAAHAILVDLGLPSGQQNDRTAYCLLALLDMRPSTRWEKASAPLMGITPIMDWARDHYGAEYAPNTREIFRRQSMHQFVEAGICLYNPDKPDRPVNSPSACYQIEPALLTVLKEFGTPGYRRHLFSFLKQQKTLAERYAREREMNMVPVSIATGNEIRLSAGVHSVLIKEIVEQFAPRFAPNSQLVYVGDTGDKHGYFDTTLLSRLGVVLDKHGKLPDVVIYEPAKNWLYLIESVTSHGPVDHKRYIELSRFFEKCTAGLVFISAFPDRKTFLRYLDAIAWETEVWLSESPTHMIHFNGSRFLGPYNPR